MLKVDVLPGTLVIHVDVARLDLRVSRSFKREIAPLLSVPVAQIVLDLSAVESIDTFGLNSLVDVLNTSRRQRKTLCLRHVGPAVRYILDLTRITELFAPVLPQGPYRTPRAA